MNRFLYQNLPLYSMSDGFGGGSSGIRQIATPLDQLGDDGAGEGDITGRETRPARTNQNQDDVSLDPDAILSQFWDKEDAGNGDDDDSQGEGDDDEGAGDGDPPRNRQQQQQRQPDNGNQPEDPGTVRARQVATQLQEGIERIALPKDLLPADFDPSNREQLGNAFMAIQKHTARQTMGLIFPIMRDAITSMRETLQGEMDKRIQGNTSRQRTEAALIAAIPEAADPALGPVVKNLFKQATARHKDSPDKAIAATKRAMQALGMKLGGGNRQPGDGQQTRRQGQRDPLDQFFDMPPEGQGNPVQRRMQPRNR